MCECANCGESITGREAERYEGWCKRCWRKSLEDFTIRKHNDGVEEARNGKNQTYIKRLLNRVRDENLCLVESWDSSKWSTKQYCQKLLAPPETPNGYMVCVQELKSHTSEALNPLLYMTSATSRDGYWSFIYEYNKPEEALS